MYPSTSINIAMALVFATLIVYLINYWPLLYKRYALFSYSVGFEYGSIKLEDDPGCVHELKSKYGEKNTPYAAGINKAVHNWEEEVLKKIREILKDEPPKIDTEA